MGRNEWCKVPHIFRAIAGLVHELLEVIKAHRDDTEHPFFQSVLLRLDKGKREAWQALVAVATGGEAPGSLGRRLLLLRNKVFFHYDPKAIFIGYCHHFFGNTRRDDRAFISRGSTMRQSRLYFADAAAVGYLHTVAGKDQTDKVLIEVAEAVERINRTLFAIVDSYIQRRACPYRADTEES